MVLNKDTYIGNYLRVWMPTYTVDERDPICPNCGHQSYYGDFCEKCGTKKNTKKYERTEHPYELIEDIFGDGDTFSSAFDWNDEAKYIILLPNCGQDGGDIIGDDFEEPIPVRGISHSDWHKLTDELEKRNIQHEYCYGIVNYWL